MQLARLAEREIAVVVGAELIAGGLDAAEDRDRPEARPERDLDDCDDPLGKVFDNLMVDVAATNEKLRARVRRIVAAASGATDEAVEEALAAAGGSAKVAIVSLLAEIDAGSARTSLAPAGGDVRAAVRQERPA